MNHRQETERSVQPLVCQQCARERAYWNENCPHAIDLWKKGYDAGLRDRVRPRLTSEDVRRATSDLSASWENFYHLAADSLNRILDEKEKGQ